MTYTVALNSNHWRGVALDIVRRAPTGHIVTIKPPSRTLDQNNKMWPMLTDLSLAKPEGRMMTPDLWKAATMSACGHEVQFLQGIDNTPPFPLGHRSSNLSKAQMADLITFIYHYGDRHGVRWSEPNPYERTSND